MSADPDTLGIFVTSPQHMRHVLGVVSAAFKAGRKVKVFFTYKATHLTKHPDFFKLSKICNSKDLAICAKSYSCEGYDTEKDIPRGLLKNQMSSQEYHAEMIRECGKYLSL